MKPHDFFTYQQGNPPELKQACAVLVHQMAETSSYYACNRSDRFVASFHEFVKDNQGHPVIGAGRLMSKQDIETLLRSLLDIGEKRVELLPANVVSLSETHIAWTVSAKARPMLFKIAGTPLRSLTVPWPRLLMVAHRDGKLAVCAMKAQGRPTAKTRLYAAPLMNVFGDGLVCTGSATLPDGCAIEQLPNWEAVMFETAFSHTNNDSTLRLSNKEKVDTAAHYRFWRSLAKDKAEKFPHDYLVPLGSSLQDFIGRHV